MNTRIINLFALLFLAVIGLPNSANAAKFVIKKGAEDLLQNPGLSQPFTIFDQIMLGLDRKATKVADSIRPRHNDFRLMNSNALGVMPVISTVTYNKKFARTLIEFDVAVSRINAPWRDICKENLKTIVDYGLALPSNNSAGWPFSAMAFFSPFVGPNLTYDKAMFPSYKAFSDSILVTLQFSVVNAKNKNHLTFMGQCSWDNKTGQVSFYEHKY